MVAVLLHEVVDEGDPVADDTRNPGDGAAGALASAYGPLDYRVNTVLAKNMPRGSKNDGAVEDCIWFVVNKKKDYLGSKYLRPRQMGQKRLSKWSRRGGGGATTGGGGGGGGGAAAAGGGAGAALRSMRGREARACVEKKRVSEKSLVLRKIILTMMTALTASASTPWFSR